MRDPQEDYEARGAYKHFDEVPADFSGKLRAQCQHIRPNGERCTYSLTFASNMREWAKQVMARHIAKHKGQL
jgi:hypothetical protein